MVRWWSKTAEQEGCSRYSSWYRVNSSDGGVGSFGMFVCAKSSDATFPKESDCPVVVVPIYHGTATSPPDKEEEEEDWEWVQWK